MDRALGNIYSLLNLLLLFLTKNEERNIGFNITFFKYFKHLSNYIPRTSILPIQVLAIRQQNPKTSSYMVASIQLSKAFQRFSSLPATTEIMRKGNVSPQIFALCFLFCQTRKMKKKQLKVQEKKITCQREALVIVPMHCG